MIIIISLMIVASSIQANAEALLHPKMIVFDMEYMLWPSGTDLIIELPITRTDYRTVTDASGLILTPLPDILDVLKLLREYRIPAAVITNNTEVHVIDELIHFYGWSPFFTSRQVYPGPIKKHLKRLSKDFKIGFGDMMYYGRDKYNINAGKELGILSFFAKYGVRWMDILDGMIKFQKPKDLSNVVSITSGIKRT